MARHPESFAWRAGMRWLLPSLAFAMLVGCERSASRPSTDTLGARPVAPVASVPDGFDTVRVERERPGGGMTVHTALTVADDTTARISLQFRGDAVPSYYIGYAGAPVQQCGSGEPVTVSGAALLHIRLTPTDAHEFVGEAAVATITDRRRRLTGPLVRELVMICDFEGQVEWVVGLDRKAAFRVRDDSASRTLMVELWVPPLP